MDERGSSAVVMYHGFTLPNSTARLGRNVNNQESGKVWKKDSMSGGPGESGCRMRAANAGRGMFCGGELLRRKASQTKVHIHTRVVNLPILIVKRPTPCLLSGGSMRSLLAVGCSSLPSV